MTDAELQQINAKFNEQLQLQIEGKFPKPQYNSVDVRKQLISAAKIIESFESSKDSCTFLLINLVFGRDDKRSSPCHFEHPLALSSRSNHPLSIRLPPVISSEVEKSLRSLHDGRDDKEKAGRDDTILLVISTKRSAWRNLLMMSKKSKNNMNYEPILHIHPRE